MLLLAKNLRVEGMQCAIFTFNEAGCPFVLTAVVFRHQRTTTTFRLKAGPLYGA
jgi:hypothetical protein